MFKKLKKKGVSPVIAVVLMVAVAVALAVIIYAWASGYITGETGKASSTTSYALISEEKRFDAAATQAYQVYMRNTSIPIDTATNAFDLYVDGVLQVPTNWVIAEEVDTQVDGTTVTWSKGEVWLLSYNSAVATNFRSGSVLKLVHKTSGYELVVIVP